MEILGVDFSGAKTDNRTWVARGELGPGGLSLRGCAPVGRANLAETLLSLPGGSVAAMDFPFSVPQDFARFWRPEAESMPDLWAAASAISLGQFVVIRNEFVARFGESKRRCDIHFPESYSCLHQANPNMVPMTFYGMQMLGPLWQAGCAVPPIETSRKENGSSGAVLLEVMPGAALKALGLPYKGYKNGANAHNLRRRILEGLEAHSGVAVENLAAFHGHCLASHDCLDALVAAVAAALWDADPSGFWRPCVERPDGADQVALLEGWLYAPSLLGPPIP